MKNKVAIVTTILLILGVLALFNELGKNTTCQVTIPSDTVGGKC